MLARLLRIGSMKWREYVDNCKNAVERKQMQIGDSCDVATGSHNPVPQTERAHRSSRSTCRANHCNRGTALALSTFIIFLLFLVMACSLQSVTAQDTECRLSFHHQPSDSCMLGGTLNMRKMNKYRLADIFKISLPFPFRWFNRVYNGNVYASTQSIIIFGGGDFNSKYKCGRGDSGSSPLCPSNPPFPSIFMSSTGGHVANLYEGVSLNPPGWRVRFVNVKNSVLPEDLEWEVIFLQRGGLQLCVISVPQKPVKTSDLKFVGPYTTAVSDGQSASFVKTFDLQAKTLYMLSTSCDGSYACVELPNTNGMRITSQQSSVSCLKGVTSMTKICGGSTSATSCSQMTMIHVPFPFRWYDRVYKENVFVRSNSIITFGDYLDTNGEPIGMCDRYRVNLLNATNTPVPSLLIGAFMRTSERSTSCSELGLSLFEGPDPLGWRIRYEIVGVPNNNLFNIKGNVVWEAVFLKDGGLLLCTAWCESTVSKDFCINRGLSNAAAGAGVSGAQNGRSSFVGFELLPSTLYKFTTSCTQMLQLSFSAPIASLAGSTLSAVISPAILFSSDDTATLIVTLQGAGFSCPDITMSSEFASGTASIIANSGGGPLLRVFLSGVRNRTVSSFKIPSITMPKQPQGSLANLSFAVFGSNGTQIVNGTSSLDAVFSSATFPNWEPTVDMSNPSTGSISDLTVRFCDAFVPSGYSPSVVVISLAGAGWSLTENSTVTFTVPKSAVLEKVNIVQGTSSIALLTVSFQGIDRIEKGYWNGDQCEKQGSRLEFTVSSVTTPVVAQAGSSSVRSAILNPNGSVLVAGSKGRMVAIEAAAMGTAMPRITIDPPLASFNAATFSVMLSPLFAQQSVIAPGKIVVTLAGAGIACAADAAVKFNVPFSGAAAVANVDTSTRVPVLTVTLTSGTYLSGYPISFQFGPCFTPTLIQQNFNNIRAAMFDEKGAIVAASGIGTLERVVEGLGAEQPELTLNDTLLTLTVTPSVLLPAGSSLSITLTGVALVSRAPLPFGAVPSGASGSVSFTRSAFGSVVIVTFSSNIAARSVQIFTVSPVFGGSCVQHVRSANISAVALDIGGSVLAASRSGTFFAASSSSSMTVSRIIASSANGIIILPGAVFAGGCNCNNTIDQNVPARSQGAIVELRGTASATKIDCSGTGMRCLIVRDTSISIVGVIFKGGSSPQFLSSDMLQAITLVQATVAAQSAQFFDDALFSRWDISHKTRRRHLLQHPPFSSNFQRKEPRTRHQTSAKGRFSKFRRSNIVSRSEASRRRRLAQNSRTKSSYPNFRTIQNQSQKMQSRRRLQRTEMQKRHGVMQLSDKLLGTRSASRAQTRLLLQSSPFGVTTFGPSEAHCGGCIAVLAPNSAVSLMGVTLSGCSAMYGGGGFFNASAFTAVDGSAVGNVARQGGGMFITALTKTVLASFVFTNNTVATAESSSYLTEIEDDGNFFKIFKVLPDPMAAVGGGVWVQSLSSANNCKFYGNLALAAGANTQTTTSPSPHAIGSSMFVLNTQRGSLMSNLAFHQSVLQCAGGGCVAAGTLFIGTTEQDTVLSDLSFQACSITAMATIANKLTLGTFAMGACAVFSGQPSAATRTTVRNVNSTKCSIFATGSIQGGCLHFVYGLYNSTLTDSAAVDLVLIGAADYGSDFVQGGFLAARIISNSSVVSTSINNLFLFKLFKDSYLMQGGVYGGAISIDEILNSRIMRTVVQNATYDIGYESGLEGGVIYILESSNVNISETSLIDTHFKAIGYIGGGVISIWRGFVSEKKTYITGTLSQNVHISCLELRGGLIHASNPNNFVPYIIISGTSARGFTVEAHLSVSGGLIYFEALESISETSVQNMSISVRCGGEKYCGISGGVLCSSDSYYSIGILNINILNTSLQNILLECSQDQDFCFIEGAVIVSLLGEIQNSNLTMISAANLTLRCFTDDCRVRGGILSAAMYNSSVSNVAVENVTLSCSGDRCRASSAGFFVSLLSLTRLFDLSFKNVRVLAFGNTSSAVGSVVTVLASNLSELHSMTTIDTHVSSYGASSSAAGGVIFISAGSLRITRCSFWKSELSCVGDSCQALGGALAVISSLPRPVEGDSKFKYAGGWADPNNVTVFESSCGSAVVACLGSNCAALGGAIFAGVAYRGIKGWSLEPTIGSETLYDIAFYDPISILASPGLAPMAQLCIDASSFTNNSVRSSSTGSILAGAGLVFFPCLSNISNSNITGNSISGVVSSEGSAFVGGAGIYAADPRCHVSISVSTVSGNDAGASGSGGGIFIGTEATLKIFKISVQLNSAGKGGGLHVDAAYVLLFQSIISGNAAATQGGGLFCVSKLFDTMDAGKAVSKGNSTVILRSVELSDNKLTDSSLTVGAEVYVFGAVQVQVDRSSRIFMKADPLRTTLGIVLSVSDDSIISSMESTVCLSGTILSIARTDVENQRSVLFPPSAEDQEATQCFPACLNSLKIESYTAANGILASCVPCPADKYSLSNSSNTSDTISEVCVTCPFGAKCFGGNSVRTLESYWGWKVSETKLASEFLQVPEGYGCESEDCTGIDSCGHNHSGVLCGGCVSNFSAAFFTTECVSNDLCASWKAWLLLCGAAAYCFLFTIFLRYQPEFSNNGCVVTDESGSVDTNEHRSSAFQVLMWYYQLTGLLLTMPNPLKFFDGNTLLLNIIGLVFGSVPVSQAFELPSIVFCTKAGSAPSDIILANILFYVLWAMVMVALTFKRVWLPLFKFFHSCFNFAPSFWEQYESACEALALWGALSKFLAFFVALKWSLAGVTFATIVAAVWRILVFAIARARLIVMWLLYVMSFHKFGRRPQRTRVQKAAPAVAARAALPAEIRGKSWLDFGVAAYSALFSLLVQCTTCVSIEDMQVDGNPSPKLRWFYDGRVSCFSDFGEISGTWQIAAVIGVVLFAMLPLLLAIYMNKALKKSEESHNVFDISALPTYIEQFNSSNRHWFTVMFYQRIVLTFVIFYTIVLSMPFLRGLIAWIVCIAILALDIVYKPYANSEMQRLSSVCCFMLVIISSVLLRSQVLLSSARPINFDPKEPNRAAESLPFEVHLTIWIILACITIPFVVLFKPLSMLQACMMVLKLCWLKLRQLNERRNRRTFVDDRSNSMQLKDSALLVASDAARNDGADLEMDLFVDANSNAPDQRVGCDKHSATLSVSAQKRAHDALSIPLEPAPLQTANSVEKSTERSVHDAAETDSSVTDDSIAKENGAAGMQHLEEDAANSMQLVSSSTATADPLLAQKQEHAVVLAAKSSGVARAQSLITGNVEPDAESVHLSIMSILFKIPQIKAMPRAAVESAVRASVRLVGTPGEMLIRKGDINTFMIYLVVGSLRVIGDDEKQFVDVHHGNLVGSQAFIYKRPRSANICCFGHCVFYRFELGRVNSAPPVYLSKEESSYDGLELVVLSSSAGKADVASVEVDAFSNTSNVPTSQSNLLQDSAVAAGLNAQRRGAESATHAAMRYEPARLKKHLSQKPQDSGPPPITVTQRLRVMGVEYEEC